MKDSSPLFTILAILAILSGTVVLIGAEGAIHEIEALILFLIAAVLISGAGVLKLSMDFAGTWQMVRRTEEQSKPC